MSNNYFRFKQFTVVQAGAAMKVGTDGVFIGAWAALRGDEKRILDIGTGTGLIALMAAQRVAGARVDAVEIDPVAAAVAADNVAASPWSERVEVINSSIQRFAASTPHVYDHIISNPPYFTQSLRSADESRTVARHTTELSYGELADAVSRLLAPEGLFSVIFPYTEANVFIAEAVGAGLYCRRRTDIYGVEGGPLKRVALEFSPRRHPLTHDSIYIEKSARGDYSDEYRTLTKDFYLKF